jgi:hypothetical protein
MNGRQPSIFHGTSILVSTPESRFAHPKRAQLAPRPRPRSPFYRSRTSFRVARPPSSDTSVKM